MKTYFLLTAIIFVLAAQFVQAQQHSENSADKTLRASGRVNPSTLGMEIEIPLGSYPGRGINVPITLKYSSKLWRIDLEGSIVGGEGCISTGNARYAEDSASGWTTSLDAPYIEYVGIDNLYNANGLPVMTGVCGTDPTDYYFAKRIVVHLPSGETHELRADDTMRMETTAPDVADAANWDATFFAVDGSNLRYIQNSSIGTYQLQMPDGSRYDFSSSSGLLNDKTIRQASTYTDRNGNYTTFHGSGTGFPNGYWTDTLGRQLSVPFKPEVPATAATQTYTMPGLGGTTMIGYVFHWEKLEDATSEALTYPGDMYFDSGWQARTSALFTSDNNQYIYSGGDLFNPVVLTEIELPTGESYRFSYDKYGRMTKINYPTGGKEQFGYAHVPTLSTLEDMDISGQSNFGVVDRKVYVSEGAVDYYHWTYSVGYEAPAGYKVTVNNPDGTSNERYMHRGFGSCSQCTSGNFGYDNALAGMVYETRSYGKLGTMQSRTLTHWDVTNLAATVDNGNTSWTFHNYAQWHPRVTGEQRLIYDPSNNGDALSGMTDIQYEGDLGQRDTPLLPNKTTQYAFSAITSAYRPVPGETPEPTPTPVPTPSPSSSPVKIIETTYLINDPAYSSVKSNYTAKNMFGLVTAVQIRNGASAIVSRVETVYDETGRSPGYRGNPTTLRVWDNSRNIDPTVSSAYILTHAKFDAYGNQYEATDAKGNTTATTFETTFNAFPVSVTSAVPDPNPSLNPDGVAHGSQTAFVSSATFDPTTGLPLTATDANGLETRITYDAVTLRPVNTKTYYGGSEVGAAAETEYHDEAGNYWVKSRSQIDADKWAETKTFFDGLGRAWKTEETNAGGNVFVEKEFDAEGRTKRVSNPYRSGETKIWTTNEYDEASRVIKVTLPDGSDVETGYGVSVTGAVGVAKVITDQAGKKREGITDVLGNMIRVVEDPAGSALVTDYVFDTLGNLRKTTQGGQNRYFYHDSLGRLLRARQPEQTVNANLALDAADPVTSNNQWTAKYVYDDNGNIISTTDANNKSVTASYDHLNRLTIRDYEDAATPDVGFYYDGVYLDAEDVVQAATGSVKGKTTGVKSSVSRTNYTSFDNLGRLLTHQQITDGTAYDTAYAYNLSGGLVEETYPSTRKVRYDLDANGDLSRVRGRKNANNGFFTFADNFSYDKNGSLTRMQLGNGRWENYSYNARLQITEIGLGATSAARDILKLEYKYDSTTASRDNNGSLREQKITVPGIAEPFVQTYIYDDLNRLKSATETNNSVQTWKQTFDIDRYGNRKFDTQNNNTTTLGDCPTAVCNPTANTSDNRFPTASGYQYDANGNLTENAKEERFVYDTENHQTAFFNESNTGSTPDATYAYDGEGKRVKKVTAAETTVFVYDGAGKLVAEYSTALATTQQVSYLTQDHLGSPRVVTNEDSTVIDRKDYSAFGEESVSGERSSNSEYTAADQLRKNYTGYEKDTESGLEFAQARYYNPTHGRFTSVDPLTASASIRNPQTFNRYSYVQNSPYKFTDPLGLRSIQTDGSGTQTPDLGPWADGWSSDYNSDWQNGWEMAEAERHTNEAEPLIAVHEFGHSDSEQQDGSGQRVQNVTAEAIVQSRVAIVGYGQPGTGRNNVGDNFRRAAAQARSNLEAQGFRVIDAGELSSLYGFQNVLDRAAHEGASLIFVFSHGAGGSIDLGDGARNDRKDVTLSNVDQLRNNGFKAYIAIKACFTGSSNSGIAAALSIRLGVSVEAPTTGMSFSPFPDRPGPTKVHPSTGPTYMIPEGAGRLVICTSGICR